MTAHKVDKGIVKVDGLYIYIRIKENLIEKIIFE